jgi:hypothetical protein
MIKAANIKNKTLANNDILHFLKNANRFIAAFIVVNSLQ